MQHQTVPQAPAGGYTPPNVAVGTCDLHTNERTRVQHKATGEVGCLSDPYDRPDRLYIEVKWLEGPRRALRSQEAKSDLAVIGTDQWCRTHREWEQVTPAGDLIATAKAERPVGDLWTVSGEHGRVSYDQFANRIELHDAYGDIEAMGKRWSDEVREVVEAGDDDAVFAALRDLYRTELAGDAR